METENKDICEKCKIFKENKEHYLEQSDSIFEAVAEIYKFIENCRVNCIKYKRYKNERNSNKRLT